MDQVTATGRLELTIRPQIFTHALVAHGEIKTEIKHWNCFSVISFFQHGETVSVFQFQRCADVWNKTAVKQSCRWSALLHASAHLWNWNETKLSTVGWNEAPIVGSFVLFQFYFTMCDVLNDQHDWSHTNIADVSFPATYWLCSSMFPVVRVYWFNTRIKQVGTRPGGRCNMLPCQIVKDYRLSQKRNIFAGEMYPTICVE